MSYTTGDKLPESLTIHANATRICNSLGLWVNLTDYSACVLTKEKPTNSDDETFYLKAIYCTGYCFSLLSLLIALLIFLRYKPLHSLRNYIHAHLMGTLVIRVVAFLALYGTKNQYSPPVLMSFY
ncbi:hypothetical protein ACTXT7_001622 [Hymenolepis weldensis]